jgi:multidrug efflux pump subunit AcrA (membrane-fusion protein)
VLPARVQSLSADTLASAGADGMAGYQVLLRPQRTALAGRQGPCRLRPGMDLTADVVTRDTTVLRFLLNRLRIDRLW